MKFDSGKKNGEMFTGSLRQVLPARRATRNQKKFIGPLVQSPVSYIKKVSHLNYPLLPFNFWGLHFDDDMLTVIERDPEINPYWAMIEISRVQTKSGDWFTFTLDSHVDGTQYVGVDFNDMEAIELARQFPARIYDNKIKLTTDTVGRRIQCQAEYVLPDQKKIYIEFDLPKKKKAPLIRNGNAMNHSQYDTLVVLDLVSMQKGYVKKLLINGTPWKVSRLLPMIPSFLPFPFVMRLEQYVGGIAVCEFSWDEKMLRYMSDPLKKGSLRSDFWKYSEKKSHTCSLTHDGPVTTEHAIFEINEGKNELRKLIITQGPSNEDVFELLFNPSLPDFRFSWDEPVQMSLCAASVNGREGYMTADIIISQSSENLQLDLIPQKPYWAKKRPVRVTIDRDTSKIKNEIVTHAKN